MFCREIHFTKPGKPDKIGKIRIIAVALQRQQEHQEFLCTSIVKLGFAKPQAVFEALIINWELIEKNFEKPLFELRQKNKSIYLSRFLYLVDNDWYNSPYSSISKNIKLEGFTIEEAEKLIYELEADEALKSLVVK